MESKPTNLDEVQIDDTELDEVVGGKNVLDLQQQPLKNGRVAVGDDCTSYVSCVSHVSTN